MNMDVAWKATLGELELQMTKATFNTRLVDARLVDSSNGTAVIAVRNEYARQWLDGRLRETVERTLSAIVGSEVVVEFVVEEEEAVVVPNGNGRQNGNYSSNGHNQPPEPEPPPRSSDETDRPVKPGQASIRIHVSDPTSWFLKVPHYTQWFWRPYLGLVPYTLWEVLRAYGYFVRTADRDWPTIEMLSDSLGQGSRVTILGRNSTGDRPPQTGAVDTLVEARVCHHWTRGEGRQTTHFFEVLDDLGVLTPHQVGTLSIRKQVEHRDYLSIFKGFDYEGWETAEAETFIRDEWWV